MKGSSRSTRPAPAAATRSERAAALDQEARGLQLPVVQRADQRASAANVEIGAVGDEQLEQRKLQAGDPRVVARCDQAEGAPASPDEVPAAGALIRLPARVDERWMVIEQPPENASSAAARSDTSSGYRLSATVWTGFADGDSQPAALDVLDADRDTRRSPPCHPL